MSRLFRLICLLNSILFLVTSTSFAGERVFFYHTDPAGSPIAMTDSIGNVVWTADYKPFGEEQATPGIIDNNREFIGKEKDTESGMSYFGARYMRSEIGRFISPDPIGAVDPHSNKSNEKLLTNPQRLNAYAYGLNNPYRYIDSDGKLPWLIVPIVVAIYMTLDNPSQADAPVSKETVLPAQKQGELALFMVLDAASGPVPGKGAAMKSIGKTVLGHNPEYMKLAEEIGARRFSIPSEIWNGMTNAERWSANQKFLDRMIARGDEVILATPANQARAGSYFSKEIDYLRSKGYAVSSDGRRMLPPDN